MKKHDTNIAEFNRSKIYEKLDYKPEPKDYSSEIPWVVQQQIAATNGVHYVDRVGQLKEYPKYELPVEKVNGDKLMLDIGSGWGRWLVAGNEKGYTPIGIDLRLEFCQTAKAIMNQRGINGYTVVADLENLPFIDGIFNLIWSFSVIQHTHIQRLNNCLFHISRILRKDGFTKLEFPNKLGIRNRIGPVKNSEKNKSDYNSWCVRYYTPEEYNTIFSEYFSEVEYSIHSFLGIGVLKEDLKYVSSKNKLLCSVSLILTELSRLIPTTSKYADSLYIQAKNGLLEKNNFNELVEVFWRKHRQNPGDNRNVFGLLQCPNTGDTLEYDEKRNILVSKKAGVYYQIEKDIPIMVASEAREI